MNNFQILSLTTRWSERPECIARTRHRISPWNATEVDLRKQIFLYRSAFLTRGTVLAAEPP